MTAKARVAVYAGILVLALALGGGFYLAQGNRDAQSPPAGSPTASTPDQHQPADNGTPRDADVMGNATAPMSAVAQGYRLVSDTTSFAAGTAQPFRFQVVGADGQPVREFAPGHEDDLNLVVVRLDGADFQHPDPVRDMTGTWTTSLTLPAGGSYAAWVSFTRPGGASVVLGSYLSAAGDFQPQAVPSPAPSADVDGYRVELAGTPTSGTDSNLTLSVSRGGQPVTDLQSSDDAFAHLAVMRTGDLAYAFADANPQAAIGHNGQPVLRFAVRLPTPGTYWLFVEFRHLNQAHTAAITVTVPAPATPTPSPAPATAATPTGKPNTPGGT